MLIKGDSSTAPAFRYVEVKHSPVVEMISSLHVLADPPSYPRWQDWAHRTLAGMDPELLNELSTLSDATVQWSLMMDFVCYIELHNIDSAERFIASLETIDRVDFLYGMLSGLIPRKAIRSALDGDFDAIHTGSPIFQHYVSVDRARAFITREAELRTRLAAFLKTYWDTVFSPLWRTIGVQELDCLAAERRMLAQMGSESYIQSCHSHIDLEPDVIRFEKQVELTYRRADIDRVVVIISAFIAPDLMVNCVDGCLTIYKGVALAPTANVHVSEEIALFLKAISSPMKLKILIELHNAPKTTKELADSLNVAPSSISAHLHQMREAELVYPQRVQNAVYYRFLNENYQANLEYLAQIFENREEG